MERCRSVTNLLIGGVLILLTAAMGVQGATLYKLNARIDGLTANLIPTVPSTPPPEAVYADQDDADEEAEIEDSFARMRQMQAQMRAEMDRLLQSMSASFDHTTPLLGTGGYALDLEETDDAYLLRLDAPGVAEANIDVTLRGQTLNISGTRLSKAHKAEEGGRLIRKERRMGSFERVMRLPGPVIEDSLTTTVEGGVLTVRVLKADPSTI